MNPWDRRPTESPPAWAAFEAYRDQGPSRSIRAARETLGRPAGYDRLLEEWSSKHEWVARAAAWDAHLDKLVQAQLAKDRVNRARQQADLGRALQGVAGQGLRALSDRLKTAQGKKDFLRGHEVAHLAKVGFEIERVAEGDPAERLALSGPDGGGLEVRIVNVQDLPDPRKAKEPAP